MQNYILTRPGIKKFPYAAFYIFQERHDATYTIHDSIICLAEEKSEYTWFLPRSLVMKAPFSINDGYVARWPNGKVEIFNRDDSLDDKYSPDEIAGLEPVSSDTVDADAEIFAYKTTLEALKPTQTIYVQLEDTPNNSEGDGDYLEEILITTKEKWISILQRIEINTLVKEIDPTINAPGGMLELYSNSFFNAIINVFTPKEVQTIKKLYSMSENCQWFIEVQEYLDKKVVAAGKGKIVAAGKEKVVAAREMFHHEKFKDDIDFQLSLFSVYLRNRLFSNEELAKEAFRLLYQCQCDNMMCLRTHSHQFSEAETKKRLNELTRYFNYVRDDDAIAVYCSGMKIQGKKQHDKRGFTTKEILNTGCVGLKFVEIEFICRLDFYHPEYDNRNEDVFIVLSKDKLKQIKNYLSKHKVTYEDTDLRGITGYDFNCLICGIKKIPFDSAIYQFLLEQELDKTDHFLKVWIRAVECHKRKCNCD